MIQTLATPHLPPTAEQPIQRFRAAMAARATFRTQRERNTAENEVYPAVGGRRSVSSLN